MYRDARAGRWVDDLRRDILFAFRRIRRQPAASTLAVITLLAVGIGANTATFSLVHGLLLRPLPYPDSEAIVSVGQVLRGRPGARGRACRTASCCSFRTRTGRSTDSLRMRRSPAS